MKPLLLTILICLMSLAVSAEQVLEREDNIYFVDEGGEETQLTSSGKDRTPVLSPDGGKVAFIRKSDEEAYLSVGSPDDYLQSGPEGILADQVWIIDIDGENETMLTQDSNPDVTGGYDKWNGEDVVAHIDDDTLCFSPDSKKVYFITSAWVTSGAVHCVNIDGTNEQFVIPGNSIMIIDEGEYKDHLIVRQHKYFLGAGSYDWLWLFTPEGKLVGPVGPELTNNQRSSLFSDWRTEKEGD
ncbi:TolB family protein [Candidatus Omnitrophota bacterium]